MTGSPEGIMGTKRAQANHTALVVDAQRDGPQGRHNARSEHVSAPASLLAAAVASLTGLWVKY